MATDRCDMLIKAQCCITQDKTRRVIDNAGLAVTDGVFTDVGTWDEVSAHYHADQTMDLGPSLILPGLVNAHTHASMTLLRGLADDLPLMQWLTEHIFPVEQKLTPELVNLGARLACAEMLRSGTTCFHDMYLMESAVAEAADACGLRAVTGEVIFAFPSPAYADLDAALDLVRAQFDRWKDHPRVGMAVMPHAVYTTTPELLERTFALAEELDIPVHMHLAETAHETSDCLEKFGDRPVAYAKRLGLLSPRLVVAHAVDLELDEIETLSSAGVHAVHCPESNMKLANGFCRVQRMLDLGVNVALGTDGAASNNNLNMFTEMASAALLQKVHRKDPTVLNAQTVLDMATVNGAKALGLDHVGAIAPGMAADCTALDLTSPNLQPMYNPVSHVVYATAGGDVRMTMIDGRVLYLDGKFPEMDYDGLLKEIAVAGKWVRDQFK